MQNMETKVSFIYETTSTKNWSKNALVIMILNYHDRVVCASLKIGLQRNVMLLVQALWSGVMDGFFLQFNKTVGLIVLPDAAITANAVDFKDMACVVLNAL